MVPSLRLLALADSAFPSGGFAHSAGLEAHAALRWVRSPREVAQFAEESIWQSALHLGPFLLEAHRAAVPLAELDLACDARLSAPVANRASRTQGRTFFSTARSVFRDELGPLSQIVATLSCSHHAPLYGATLAALGVAREESLLLFLFSQARGIFSAAVRLGLLGPHEAQAMLDEHGGVVQRAHAEAMACSLESAAVPFPLLDLRQNFHDALYARLFLS